MPDWRKAEDYQQFTTDFPDFRWAWEFLRRNKEYRRDWSEELEQWRNLPEPTAVESLLSRFSRNVDDPDSPGFYIRTPKKDEWFLKQGMLNPSTDDPEALYFSLGYGAVTVFNPHYKHKLSLAGVRHPWAVFDLTLPLDRQIEEVHRKLLDLQTTQKFKPKKIKQHRKKWPYYVRLLDADLDDRKPAQIANALYMEPEFDGLDSRKVSEQLSAAKKMTQPEGYLSIFLSKPVSGKSGD